MHIISAAPGSVNAADRGLCPTAHNTPFDQLVPNFWHVDTACFPPQQMQLDAPNQQQRCSIAVHWLKSTQQRFASRASKQQARLQMADELLFVVLSLVNKEGNKLLVTLAVQRKLPASLAEGCINCQPPKQQQLLGSWRPQHQLQP